MFPRASDAPVFLRGTTSLGVITTIGRGNSLMSGAFLRDLRARCADFDDLASVAGPLEMRSVQVAFTLCGVKGRGGDCAPENRGNTIIVNFWVDERNEHHEVLQGRDLALAMGDLRRICFSVVGDGDAPRMYVRMNCPDHAAVAYKWGCTCR